MCLLCPCLPRAGILTRGIDQKGVQSLHLIALRVAESKDGPAVSCARAGKEHCFGGGCQTNGGLYEKIGQEAHRPCNRRDGPVTPMVHVRNRGPEILFRSPGVQVTG